MKISDIEKYDLGRIYKVYDKWPQIAKNSFCSLEESVDFENINHIVFAGMGGSGAIGDLFSSILSSSEIHVNVVKGYVLPKATNSKSLVIVISVSGNSNETLSILKSAKDLGSDIIAFSSGGIMKEYCEKNKIKHRFVKSYHSPRATFPSYVYCILKTLQKILKIKNIEIQESIKELEIMYKKINSSNLSDQNPALELANWISGTPIIYYPIGLHAAAIRFKNSLQENAKIHVISEDIIEACHNGIVAWEKERKFLPILLIGEDDHIKTRERWVILKKYFKQNKIKYKEIKSINGNILSKLITLVYFFDYVSIYKAINDKIDPSPVKSIDYIKSELS